MKDQRLSRNGDLAEVGLRPTAADFTLARAISEHPALILRADAEDGGDGTRTMTGHFAVFNEWTEINSWIEGRFLERIAPGAFAKTMREQRDRMRVLFQHGRDSSIGSKPLGPIDIVREDETGGYYEVPLLDTSYVRDLVPGLEAGLYGASFQFRVMREEYVEEPEASDHNPQGLPERTIKEAQVFEFGPVTWPAYPSATAGVRCVSLTDMIHEHAPELSSHGEDDDPTDAPAAPAARRESPAPTPSRIVTPGASKYLNPKRKSGPSWRLP